MGKVTDNTPRSDILQGYIVKPSTFMPNGMDLSDITSWFGSQYGAKSPASGDVVDTSFSSLFASAPTQVCDTRAEKVENADIVVSLRKPTP
jgi:hypothetical protein